MITLYETARGDFAPAWALTPTEALAAYDSGHLLAADFCRLTTGAADAIRLHVAERRCVDPGALILRENARGGLELVGVWERGQKRTVAAPTGEG